MLGWKKFKKKGVVFQFILLSSETKLFGVFNNGNKTVRFNDSDIYSYPTLLRVCTVERRLSVKWFL